MPPTLEAHLASPLFSASVGQFLCVDDAVRLLRASKTLWSGVENRAGSRALVKAALHFGGCSAAIRTRCVARWHGPPLPALCLAPRLPPPPPCPSHPLF